MKRFKPFIIIILGVIFLTIFFGLFFILIEHAEERIEPHSQNIKRTEDKPLKQQ